METMKRLGAILAGLCMLALGAHAQDRTASMDRAVVTVVRHAEQIPAEGFSMNLVHPYHVEARHPKTGCDDTEVCGELYYSYDSHNLRTSAGTQWQSALMGSVSTPTVNTQCNYLALTNTAVTPAEADTTLSGEIVANGLSRAQATYTDASTTLAVPGAPALTVQGTTGAVTYWYAVIAVNQGILTTPSTATSTTTANATLSAANNVQVAWTPISGASSYYVLRNTSNSFSGSMTAVAGGDSTSQPDCSTGTCYIHDIANSLGGTAVTVPGSNLTNFGKYTLVHTWTATATQSAQAFGALTAASSGTMCFEGIFTPVSLNASDTFQLTETVYF